MLYHTITMRKFVEYLHDLTMSICLKLNSTQGSESELPIYKPMVLGSWAESNEKINELQQDFEEKSRSLVHSLMTERKIQETTASDYLNLKAKYEQL